MLTVINNDKFKQLNNQNCLLIDCWIPMSKENFISSLAWVWVACSRIFGMTIRWIKDMHFSLIQNFSMRSFHCPASIRWKDHRRRNLCCLIGKVQRFSDLRQKRIGGYHLTSMMLYLPKSFWVSTVSGISSRSTTSLSLSFAAAVGSCWMGRWEL